MKADFLVKRRVYSVAAVLLASLLVVVFLPSTEAAKPTKPEKASAPDSSPVSVIYRHIRQGWQDEELKPSETATDGEWCRRVYLDVLGRIPSVKELDRYLEDKSPKKREYLVDRLLGDEYLADYTRNWTTIWTNILIGRNGGNERRSLTNRAGMQKYLRESFRANKPYHQMAEELISATGDSKPGESKFSGAVNFLAMKLDENGVLATSKTSEVFMGIRVQCTQCHDHPFNRWKQNQFWEMNAFFRQTRSLRRFSDGRNVRHIELVNQDFPGEGGDPEEAEIFYEKRNSVLKVAYPVFTDLDGSRHEVGKSGYLSDVNRRSELAKLIVNSGYLPRAIVNRMWAHFLGYGFTKPINDMGPHNPPSHPELLDHLATEFQNSNYDLKQLIRWITLSEAYSLSSRMNDSNRSDDPLLGAKAMFSHFYLRQMRAEELYESLLVATEAHKTGGDEKSEQTAKQRWLRQFVIAFGTDENDEMTTFDGTIPQTLMMFNGDLIKKATSTKKGGFLHRVALDEKLRGSQKLNFLFKAALARRPTTFERRQMGTLMRDYSQQTEALRDVWWVLLNMNEFIMNH